MNLIIKLFVYSIAIAITAYLLPGIHVADWQTLVIVSAVLLILRAIVKPVLLILTLPFTILTLGLFIFVVNGIIILMADAIVPGFQVDNLLWAILFSLVLSLFTSLLESMDKSDTSGGSSSRRKVGSING
jgi:putative membrane protein